MGGTMPQCSSGSEGAAPALWIAVRRTEVGIVGPSRRFVARSQQSSPRAVAGLMALPAASSLWSRRGLDAQLVALACLVLLDIVGVLLAALGLGGGCWRGTPLAFCRSEIALRPACYPRVRMSVRWLDPWLNVCRQSLHWGCGIPPAAAIPILIGGIVSGLRTGKAPHCVMWRSSTLYQSTRHHSWWAYTDTT